MCKPSLRPKAVVVQMVAFVSWLQSLKKSRITAAFFVSLGRDYCPAPRTGRNPILVMPAFFASVMAVATN
jgi:hypothetical protein